jgi:hypothetical protein
MPKQHVLFGRPVPRIPPRRITFLLCSVALFAVFTLIIALQSAIPTGPSLSKFADHKFSIPNAVQHLGGKGGFGSSVFNPFKPASHAPPRTDNDTYGDVSWLPDWSWLSIPFSSSVTLDEDRSLLPPLPERKPIYCYYDNTAEKETKKAESALLLTWRRAWWAQGFKPIILSSAEAMNNPLYKELQGKSVDPTLKTDMMRWLAWENMGGGLLAHHLALPMAERENALLTQLRTKKIAKLTRWKGLEDGLFAGPKAEIAAALKLAISSTQLKTAKSFISALPTEGAIDPFVEETTPNSVAYYDAKTLTKKYAKIAEEMTSNKAAGLRSLNKLINSHLHTTWQNIFRSGIAVLKPLPAHSSKMIDPAFQLAQTLTQCGESPIQSSCPPNQPKCNQCVAAQLRLTTPARYSNSSNLYTIGTVPHPYTMATLNTLRERIDIPWIRRDSERDPWITALTKDINGPAVPSAPRVLKFKEAVAGPFASARSLWLSAEEAVPADIDWHFGFEIPREVLSTGRSETPVPGPERRPQPEHDIADGPVAKPEELAREPKLLQRAEGVVLGTGPDKKARKDKQAQRMRDALEAWCLGDTEAWRFARGFLARERLERILWEEEEKKYAEGVGSEGGRRSPWRDWID